MSINEITIDGFCGGGGWSTGFEAAIAEPVTIGINHDKDAIAMHKVNHPQTKHYNENIFEVNPREACDGRSVGWAHFSPDCTHFSVAKGGKPVKKTIRGLAWVIVKWAGTVKPRIISIENVPEFVNWCPLVAKRDKATGRVIKLDGSIVRKGERTPIQEQQLIPDKKRKGETFRKFIKEMKNLGYEVQWNVLKASDYGAPTSRRRLFIIFRNDGKPIVFPNPTHGDPKSETVKSGKLLPWHTAAECIDWNVIAKSIFERDKPLAEATLLRIARGIKKFIADSPEPFIINYKFEKPPESVNEPLSTITSVNGHYVIAPLITSIGQTSVKNRSRGADEPLRTVVNKNEHCLINTHIEPMEANTAPFLIQYHTETCGGEVRGQKLTEPIQTVDTSNRYGLATAFIEKSYGGGYVGAGSDIEKPLDTCLCEQSKARVTCKDHNTLVTAFMSKYYGSLNTNAVNGSSVNEPLHTVTSKDRCAVVAATLIQTGYGEHKGQKPRVPGLDKPLGTVVSTSKHAVITASFISRQFNTSVGHKIDEPLGTITGIDKSRLVEVFLEKHGINSDIEIYGKKYRITDICMRMLEPRELYNAQGFPHNYIIETDCYGNKYPKSKQVARCGNSVPPPFATAIVKANWAERCT